MQPEKLLMDLLLKKGYTLCTAESCTGGLISARITSLAGSSRFFKGAVIAYDNSVKLKLLSVNPKVLETFGVVSSEVVQQMALGASGLLESDCAISVSGIAGPGGGTPIKPVGLVYIGTSVGQSVTSRKYLFTGNRAEIRALAASASLSQLIQQFTQ